MAPETGLKTSALRVAEILHEFARKHGWAPEDYRLFMTINSDWNRIHVTFVSDKFEEMNGGDEYKNFDDVMDYLEGALHDDEELYLAIGMVVTTWRGFRVYGITTLGPAEEDISETHLNPDVADPRGLLRTPSR